MVKYRSKLVLSGALLLGLPLMYWPAYSAKPINLRHQNLSILNSAIGSQGIGLKEIRRSFDFKNTMHMRVQETYAGYNILGADAIIHIPNAPQNVTFSSLAATKSAASMNGIIYQDIQADLANAPANVFTEAQAQKALALAIANYQQKVGMKSDVMDKHSQLLVFVDKDNKAHWAYEVKFHVDAPRAGMMPAKPGFIMDAITFKIYAEWNDVKTAKSDDAVAGGGFGGNLKMGKVVYDGLENNLAKLSVTRNASTNTCYMKNAEVTVKTYGSRAIENFPCKETDSDHGDIYWSADLDAVNGGYSPANDALFGGNVIKDMYQNWYGVPVLTQNGKPMMLNMVVHDPIDNAYWDGSQMTFGDGVSMFYPLTSLGVAAHEISHGFTEQHSGLYYWGQSGGMNEAFSDMAAQGAEFFAYGKNSWQIGPEIFKAKDRALRYMDKPSKDCNGKQPGNWCSIDNFSQYHDGLDVHFSSGIYNRIYYLIGSADNWDARKAFDVMVHANMNYWTSYTSFAEGACGVLSATKDLGYDDTAVKAAFDTVGVSTSKC